MGYDCSGWIRRRGRDEWEEEDKGVKQEGRKESYSKRYSLKRVSCEMGEEKGVGE